ncbi:nitrous oxide reductase accessory protein NosL [Lysinibacillus antri]|nr:nitrous oxide reductase accessory protein NosL [Lysinibacillus antri]
MKWKLVLVVGLLMILAACSSKEPRDINSATDVCEVCNMSVSSEEHAAQIVMDNGDYTVFDDLGCLMEFMMDADASEIGGAFVKDASENKWLNIEKATYVYSEGNWTPMNYGVLAFDSKKSAENWIEKEGMGKLLSYDDLQGFEWGVHH